MKPAAAPLAPPPAPAAKALPLGVPMDIDTTRARLRQTPNTCRRCGQVGHWQKQCPRNFDVRYMSEEELDDLAQHLLARLDVRATETLTPAILDSEQSEETPEEIPEGQQDFVDRSG